MNESIDMKKVLAHNVSGDFKYPWETDVKRLNKEKLLKRDRWQRQFMPSGAFVAARTDQLHWLTFGTAENVPLLFGKNPLLMSDDSSRAVTRIGRFANKSGSLSKLAKSMMSSRKAIGWSTIPEQQELIVRLSGLVWPEAAQRLANSAQLTQERKGKGQIILFATQPNFRGATKTTNRLFLNAVVFGPGFGTTPLINL
jgi:hypothetical protein